MDHLDDEDLEVAAEAMRDQEEENATGAKTFRRLKRAAATSDSDEDAYEGGGTKSRLLFEDDDGGADAPAEAGGEATAYDDGTEWADEGDGFYDDSYAGGGLTAMQQQQLREVFGNDFATLFDIIGGRRPKFGPKDIDGGRDDMGDGAIEGEVTTTAPTVSEEDVEKENIRTKDEPERLQIRYKHRPAHVSDSVIAEEAQWLLYKFKLYSETCPLPFSRLAENTLRTRGGGPNGSADLNPMVEACGLYPKYPLCDLLNEQKQRQRYKETFKNSGVLVDEGLNIEAELTDKIQQTLQLLLNDRCEPSFIATHKHHLLCPPLTVEAIWKIYEWDVQWWRFNESRRVLLAEAKRLPDVCGETLINMLVSTNEEAVLSDFRAFLSSKAPPDKDLSTAEPEETNGKRRPKRRKINAPADGLYHKYFLQSGLREKWAPYIMSPDRFAAVLREHQDDLLRDMEMDDDFADMDFNTDVNLPVPPVLLERSLEPEHALNEWLRSMVSGNMIPNPENLADTIVKFESRALALHPEFRGILRFWFFERVSVTSVTTSKGEKAIEPSASSWLPSRLFKKPLKELMAKRETIADEELVKDANAVPSSSPHDRWRREIRCEDEANRAREFGLEMLKAEKQELLTCIFHPLASQDPAPWRPPMTDEIRWKRGKLKHSKRLTTVTSSGDRNRYGADRPDQYVAEWARLEASDKEDEQIIDGFIQRLARHYCPPQCPPVWRRVLVDILTSAVCREVLPLLRKEARNRLIQSSEDYIIEKCQQNLLWRLSIRPLRHPFVPDERYPCFPDFQCMTEEEEDYDDETQNEPNGPSPSDMRESFEADVPLRFYPAVTALVVEKPTEAAPETRVNVHLVAINRSGVPNEVRMFENLYLGIRIQDEEEERARRRANGDAELRSNFTSKDRAEAKKDWTAFEAFLLSRRTRPNVVVVGSNTHLAIELWTYVEKIKNRIRPVRFRFLLEWISLEIPQVVAQAPGLCPPDFREHYGYSAAQALSAAKLAQAPLAETISLWNSSTGVGTDVGGPNHLLSLRLHHLQTEVSKAQLEGCILNVIVRVVNDVGVQLNRLRSQKNLRPLLQFVAGFGPIKASAFLSHMYSAVIFRRGLQVSEKEYVGSDDYVTSVGDAVFHNCASFIRIRRGEEFGIEKEDEVEPMDSSRIHPEESASHAIKMCKDAQEDSGSGDDRDRKFIDQTFKRPEKLEELDLEAYAEILGRQGQPRMLPLLEFIKREVEAPFSDPRCLYSGPTMFETFYRLAAEDPHEFHRCSEVQLQVQRGPKGEKGERTIICIPSGCYARVLDADGGRRHDWQPGTVLKGRIDGFDYNLIIVDVIMKPENIRDLLESSLGYQRFNTHTLSPLIEEDLYLASHLQRRSMDTLIGDVPKQRRIHHPKFRAMSGSKMIDYLKQHNRLGQVFFRPSETHNTGLTLYIQTCTLPFKFKTFGIAESEKLDASGIGEELTFNHQKYTDINEIISTFCTPFTSFLDDLFQHEKYHAGVTPDELSAKLCALAQRDYRSIQWGVCIDPTNNHREPFERFVIVAVTTSSRSGVSRPVKDSLYVSAKGYRLWLKNDRNVKSLINWWKSDGFKNRAKYVQEYQQYKQEQQKRIA
eukprot:Blabericola_migrator_1__452@NODE_1108_length_5412_cov_42_147428_g758_i0_p1_GENE_NODE_1108_length_5412_cov_42_147428_g758_i0NODE_1108_length_5412_cov_42_147428_g758_i0_p1_ORF_typecomplete_len1606_score291_38SH2_2/PF14633_6/5_9e36HHH_7/PF14635_6/3_3e21HTH_44/PF14641_6/1_4e10HHH_9/PF17674_1/1_5e06YqgF/PF14639_6/0_0011_NODE_1108_length_5412_cov_42_147428_g758_i03625179